MAIWLSLVAAGALQAQFEVASVKPSAPDTPGISLQMQPGGGLRATGATLKNLIALAYGVREFQVSGGPRWVETDRFDVVARTARPLSAETPAADPRQNATTIRECLKSLLEERFHLALHSEEKPQDVYALLVAKNGPKFHEAKPDSGSSIRGQKGSITGQGTTMQMLILNLSNQVGRQVLDQTGLTGRYDFKLEWTPEASVVPGFDGPPLLDAVQEQLGLRLEAQKQPGKIVVIDRLERPSEN